MLTVDPNHLGLADGDRLLDVGCGEGRHLHGAHVHADVRSVGVDLDEERLVAAREGFDELDANGNDRDGTHGAGDGEVDSPRSDVVVGDALELPFPDESFDAVVCSEVLEHLPEYGPALDEVVRLLRPGGRLGVSVPRYGPERLCWLLSDGYHRVEGGHVRIFRRSELDRALASRGLTILDSAHAHALHSPFWWLKCLQWEERERSRAVAAYERFLEWTLMNPTPRADRLESKLDPLIGKSLVLYCEKDEGEVRG